AIDRDLFCRMRDTLTHRGPDGAGEYFSETRNLALGHRRLSFIDLSENGKQPLCNEDATIWLTINGEIYNYIELRQLLLEKKHVFRSGTDSEVIIHAYEEWGIDMLNRLEGMFAFGLWDENRKKLILARDRMGIKPLYYYFDGSQLIFASEIKAIIKNPEIARDINYQSLCEYFIYRYIPSPNTIFRNIYKIEPAHYTVLDDQFQLLDTEYYRLPLQNNVENPAALLAEVDALLRKSVNYHVRSDVPVGSFLSGGYDSTAMVKYFAETGNGFNTFSIGFKGWNRSEHQYAAMVADKMKTRHRSLLLDASSLNILDDLMYYYDDPIADISIIPTYFVSYLASQHNKAVLSGEGADELFAGYTWHHQYLWPVNKTQLRGARKWGWELPVNNFDVESYAKAMAMGEFGFNELKLLLNEGLQQYIPEDTRAFYRKFFDGSVPVPKRFQLLDIKCFMGELVLNKVDRASMANSLEVRVPFLFSELFEKLLALNPSQYFDEKKQKPLLHELLKKHVPKAILNREKQGFTGPDEYYMNFDWYRKVLASSRLIDGGIINRQTVDRYFLEHDHWRLWKLVVIEKWFQKWM
ncbi:MAG TPA: asparagine synthase (glutamine-hydrolyzing), partial [Bacteroidales bacterium]|nr:asparagine synthase (glutamine-hydrolyzing) [Bacteroidales bacterium]